mmetsp:Transcript_3663/g.8425  ORF Transcript_3663/g.8425 Transcript_3663/m.8425 type:complete len:214 (+) Transcript_3663:184-825(+)
MILPRYFSIIVAVASMLVTSTDGTDIQVIKSLRVPEVGNHDHKRNGDHDDDHEGGGGARMSVEKGFRCRGGFRRGKGAKKECEGGFKKAVSRRTKNEWDLLDDTTKEVQSMHAEMMPDADSLLPEEDVMTQLGEMFESYSVVEEGEDEDGEKMVQFGGYVKLFWGCNVTFSKEDTKMSKTVACGAKTYEGMGSGGKENVYQYFEEKPEEKEEL